MPPYPLFTATDAPAGSMEALASAQKKFGMIPNVFATMAISPALLNGYFRLAEAFEQSSFTPAERQVLMLTISRHNGCDYCVAAHSSGAERAGVDAPVIAAIREDKAITTAENLAALRTFAATMVEKRGWVTEDDLSRFFGAGYTQAQALEVVLAFGLKALTNYANHITHTPLDAAFKAKEWRDQKQAS